jgi:hypothetical protein
MMLTQITVTLILSAAVSALSAAAPLQLLTQFDEAPSTIAVQEMQREMDRLYRDVHISIAWHELSGYQSVGVAPRIVFVHFEGNCRAATLPPRQAVAAVALASVNRVDGQMLPIVTVDCDRIAGYIWPAMTGAERLRGDAAFGRAIARVVCHELYHYLSGEATHTRSVLFRASISATSLLAAELRLEVDEIADLKRALAAGTRAIGTI